MKNSLIAAFAVVGIGAGAWFALSETRSADTLNKTTPTQGDAIVSVTLPSIFSDQAALGKHAFDATCAACHGQNAAGREGMGPPLVHKIYEPSHHSDMSFLVAVQNGVRAHHWGFGNMPPQEGLTRGDVINIVAYVRELQRANGING